jgi:hypothetical protein
MGRSDSPLEQGATERSKADLTAPLRARPPRHADRQRRITDKLATAVRIPTEAEGSGRGIHWGAMGSLPAATSGKVPRLSTPTSKEVNGSALFALVILQGKPRRPQTVEVAQPPIGVPVPVEWP